MHWIAALPAAAAGAVAGVLTARLAGRYIDGASVPVTVAMVTLTAAGCAAMALRFGPVPALPAYCYLAAIAVPLAVIDTRCHRLPDALTLPSYPITLTLLSAAFPFTPGGARCLERAVVTAAAVLALYTLLALASRGAIGWGDVKLSGILGLYLGWTSTHAIPYGVGGGFLLAALTAIILMLTRKADRKTDLPFGPFMLAAAVLAILVASAP